MASAPHTIGFIGLGNMGAPMAANLVKAGHTVRGFDMDPNAVARAAEAGVGTAASVADAVSGAAIVITMLPMGRHVRAVLTGEDEGSSSNGGGAFAAAAPGTLFIDCSTIDVETARALAATADAAGLSMLDAPVSGGVPGAEAATLALMVGGPDDAFRRAEPVLAAMGRAVIHTGPAGNGQAAKICNNMMAGIQMLGVAEAFTLADRLGLDPARLFEVASQASGQCWSVTAYCPVPGMVPTAPSSRGYTGGFASALMLKDLKLAQQAAATSGATTPLGGLAEALYALFCGQGHGAVDFSGIIRMIERSRS
ncbi:3-hydroxyisobutyrate dehydrogenase [Roseospira marina]|uniref:3-hydroxyisobutyrate dehydrogenase n=1 Tax=Roseospira marina TaxID=140057 RepID=A0A5M6I7G9_9PROT|nr:3-hydroxyisobutyrate dehydrogenase [Roseospira marina]KAA5604146.1 3-hydroxyisobutyrate dehydrogenase [Roseospira marina]MBB4315757.1 3-hydroxyisobutyrate dehydrogenase [Roseospira marina]MBB5088924.1 3-hydroxyisobutyrate dehydrogenase [Roseospira marina]